MVHKKFFYIGFDDLYQGYLLLLIDTESSKLLVHSDGSWYLWNKPEEALEDTKNVTSHTQSYKYAFDDRKRKTKYASWDEVVAAGWDKYVINKPNSEFS
jgi:hypothetical protein